MTKVEKKERAKIKREGRHMAAEIVLKMDKIKNVDDMMDNYYSLIFILKEELENVIVRLGYCIKKDIEYAIKLAAEHTYKTLQKRHLKGTQRFFKYGTNVEKATKFLFQRLVANVRNTHDKRYKKSLYFECEQHEATDYICAYDEREKIEREIEIEKIKNFPRQRRIEVIRKVWKDAVFDFDFDGEDLSNICKLANVPIHEILKDEVKLKIKVEKIKSGYMQTCFVFD